MSMYTAEQIAEFAARPVVARSIRKAVRSETATTVTFSGITNRLATHVFEFALGIAGYKVRVASGAMTGEGKYTVTGTKGDK